MECPPVEGQKAAMSYEEDLVVDPLVEVEVLTLLRARMDLAGDLRGAVADSGMERLQYS